MKYLSWVGARHILVLLLAIGVVVVLGRMLMPGYVLTLDMVFVPEIPAPRIAPGGYWNAALFRAPLYLLGQLFPGWLVQKMVLIGLFTVLPVQAYRFLLPKNASPSVRVIVALFYTINPFVYTRFLAGQWTILVAHSLLPTVWQYVQRVGAGERKAALYLAGAMLLTTAFSLHFGVIAAFVCLFGLIGSAQVRNKQTWISLGIAVAATFVGSLYWLVPAWFRTGTSIVEVFDVRHLEAFRTAGQGAKETLLNVLSLYGFWGEREAWADQFLWARDIPLLWISSGLVLLGQTVFGVYLVLRQKSARRLGAAMLGLGVCAFLFASGIGDTPFKGINNWLFSHVSFWQGFRDSQKWSGVLVLVYAFFLGHALEGSSLRAKRALVVITILAYTFPQLFGFFHRLKPVHYPEAWYQANAILEQDPACKALFLPWHLYFQLKFNRGLLTASPARDFFKCEMVTSRQVELGEIGQQGPIDPAYDAIEGVVTGKDGWNSEQSLEILRSAGIKYVVFAKDIQDSDPWKYEFLHQPSLKSYTWDGLTMYQLTN